MSNIFVFGSNLAGAHGAGSAKAAFERHGAPWGIGIGPQGNSYAIPTKDGYIYTMDIKRISVHVRNFLDYAYDHPELIFNIVAIGCGLAGFAPEQIAPMFSGASGNCMLPKEFITILTEEKANA